MERMIACVGLVFLVACAYVLSEKRSTVPWSTVAVAIALQFTIGALVFLLPQTKQVILIVNDAIVKLLDLSREGTLFLFGPLALQPGEASPTGETSLGFFLAFQVLPAVIFFSALMSLLYYAGLIQPIVRVLARLFKRFLHLSGAEALSSTSNIFVGIEAAFTIRPYLASLTRSEMFVLITVSMATTASTTLAIYVSFLQSSLPTIAGHLISASVLTIPAAVLIAKVMIPETGKPQTMGTVPEHVGPQHANFMGAITDGAWAGLKLAAGIAALLIAVLGLVGIINFLLATVGNWIPGGVELSLQKILGWVMVPFAWSMGIPSSEIAPAAQLLGERFILTEVVAYRHLADLAASGAITNPRTILVMSYALCGFVHIASLAIFVGGISTLVPERRDELASLGLKALVAAFLATVMTGCIAGIFY
jgi:concentrative nucleoside transporter, CNT family